MKSPYHHNPLWTLVNSVPRPMAYWMLFLLSFQLLVIVCLSTHQGSESSFRILDVGKELMGETLPLKMGQRIYQLSGLRQSTWYEVKISYPASIPCSFSIQLKRDMSHLHSSTNRRLLNTEKLIFKANAVELAKAYVLVSVEAAGIVAKPHFRERDMVLFNIVCDQLSFGIPHKAWCVGIVGVLCLALAVFTARCLHSYILSKKEFDDHRKLDPFKAS